MKRTELAEMVISAREAKGLTQEQLASRTKISLSTIASIELGKLAISREKAEKLAKALGFEIDDFVYSTWADKARREIKNQKEKMLSEYEKYPQIKEKVHQINMACMESISDPI